MHSQLDELLQKRMDRKDFLKHVGIGFVALTGVAAVLKSVTPQKVNLNNNPSVYGGAAYGGTKAAAAASTQKVLR